MRYQVEVVGYSASGIYIQILVLHAVQVAINQWNHASEVGLRKIQTNNKWVDATTKEPLTKQYLLVHIDTN